MAKMTGAAVRAALQSLSDHEGESDSLFSDDNLLNRSYSKTTTYVLRTSGSSSGSSDAESQDETAGDRFGRTRGRKPIKKKKMNATSISSKFYGNKKVPSKQPRMASSSTSTVRDEDVISRVSRRKLISRTSQEGNSVSKRCLHSKLVQVDYSNEHQDCDIEPQDKQPDGEQLKSQSGEKSDGNESGLQDNDESELQDGDVSLQGGDVLLQDGDMSLQDDDVSLQDDDLSLQDGDLSLQDGNESGMQGGGLADEMYNNIGTGSLGEESNLAGAVRQNNRLMKKLIDELRIAKDRVSALEKKVDGGARGKSSKALRVRDIPLGVRRETRRIYYLLKERQVFTGWTISPGFTYRSSENRTVLDRLAQEVKGLHPKFDVEQINAAAYTFYQTCRDQSSAQRRGKAALNQRRKRRHERTNRKFREREAMLGKLKFKDNRERCKWLSIMKKELMSSEESGKDGNVEIIKVKTLSWRSEHVNNMIQLVDGKIDGSRSAQAKRQLKPRVYIESSRPKPDGLPSWVFRA